MSVLLDGFYSKERVYSDVAEILYIVVVHTVMLKVISSKGQEVHCKDAVY